jgi:hypothetical protein
MNVLGIVAMAALLMASDAVAGPVVREAAGANAAAIQAAVDQFRADLGGANNGNTPGSQLVGRREINWDGGGAAATPTLDPSPMTRFVPRGALLVTPGTGFETSGAPAPLFEELNPGYAGVFTTFSAPRIFSPLDSNVMDVIFTLPGNGTVRAAVTGFGAVFTNVDVENATTLQFFGVDGALLYERAVPATTGNQTLSFLGVSFNAGEVVARVRIVTGNIAIGLPEKPGGNVVAMDDFIFGEPVSTAGLAVSPGTGTFFRTAGLDLVIGLDAAAGAPIGGRVTFDGADVTPVLLGCFRNGTLGAGGLTLRCPLSDGLLAPGDHVLQVDVTVADQTHRRTAVRWSVVANYEP